MKNPRSTFFAVIKRMLFSHNASVYVEGKTVTFFCVCVVLFHDFFQILGEKIYSYIYYFLSGEITSYVKQQILSDTIRCHWNSTITMMLFNPALAVEASAVFVQSHQLEDRGDSSRLKESLHGGDKRFLCFMLQEGKRENTELAAVIM